jgi:hypothetical protein
MIYVQFDNGTGTVIEEENLQYLRMWAWIFCETMLLTVWKMKGSTFKAPAKMIKDGNI